MHGALVAVHVFFEQFAYFLCVALKSGASESRMCLIFSLSYLHILNRDAQKVLLACVFCFLHEFKLPMAHIPHACTFILLFY
jgi:hypothetical protein